MSGENIAALRAVYEEWAKGNFRAGVELFDPQILMVQGREFPDGGSYLGPDGVRQFMRAFLEAWEKVTIAADELIEAGDTVVAAVVQSATGKGSGAVPGAIRYFQVWTFRGGRVIRLDVIRERADALEAAGITG
jgi:ketosteroid isomerase-like protein